jgi:hypothetical protein
LQQLSHGHIEGTGYANESEKSGVVISPLDAAHVAAIYVSHKRELLLRNSFRQSNCSNRASEGDQGRVLAFS